MSRKGISIIIAIILAAVGLYYLSMERKAEDIVPENNIVENSKEEAKEEDNEGNKVVNAESQRPEIAVGKEAPNFTLKNLEGKEVSLEDYRGKIVLVNFWATWCVYCDIEMPDLNKLDKDNDDLVVLAVNVREDKETVEKYIKEGGYDFEVVLDENGSIARTYLVGGYPASYFIDEDGILLGSVPGMMTYEQMNKALEDIRNIIESN